MISQKTQLETKIKDQDHTYQCPANATLLECLEGLNIFRSYVFGRIKEAEEANQPKPVQQEQAAPVTDHCVEPQPVILEEPQPQTEQVTDGNQQ